MTSAAPSPEAVPRRERLASHGQLRRRRDIDRDQPRYPGSCMVTPARYSAISMVALLWVMKTNCTRDDISRTKAPNRPTLASSSGASTSSNKQNGAGLS